MTVNENRKKAEWPKENIWIGLKEGTKYFIKIESYFSDHFPHRDLMLRILGQIEYSILGRSREVIVGKEGWLSDKKVLTEHLQQLDTADDRQIEVSVIKLKRLQYWLHKQGIDFLMVIVPMKPTIYPEKFPQRYYRSLNEIGLVRFQNALLRNEIPFVDVLNLLINRKDEMPLYYKTDMHWNTISAAYTAEAIVNHFSSHLLGKNIWNENITKSTQDFSGGELATMPLLFPQIEKTPVWQSAELVYKKRTIYEESISYDEYNVVAGTSILLPPAIMFGNSFMINYQQVGFQNYFRSLMQILDYDHIKNMQAYIKPQHKIFILQIYETQLLFHIMPIGRLGYWSNSEEYWGKQINSLPLPEKFNYK